MFAQCAFDQSLLRCLVTPYDAWILALPRLLASVATAFDPSLLSYALTALAAIVTAGAAVLVARAVVDTTGSHLGAFVAGASLSLVYSAGGEIGGNLTNLHWVLLAAGVAVTISTWLGHRFDWADGVLIALLVTSTPFGVLIVAFAAIGAMLRRPHMLRVTLLAGAVALVQLGVTLTTPRIGLPVDSLAQGAPLWLYPLALVRLYLDTVVAVGIFGGRAVVPDWLISGGVTVTILILLARSTRQTRPATDGRSDPAGRSSVVDAVAVGAMIGAGMAVFAASWLLNHYVTSRHIYVASALTVVAIVVGLGRLRTDPPDGATHPRGSPVERAVQVLVALALAIGFASSFRVDSTAGLGPDFPAEVAAGRPQCQAGAQVLVLRISPLPTSANPTIWEITIPCDRLRG